jgi:nucleoside-diphosphate-sugar epimerase
LPGIISWKVEPTAGTTDYAVAIFYGAIREGQYASFLGPDTRLPMMYMPDAVSSLIDVATADLDRLKHHVDYNVAAMSFTPTELAAAIKQRIPGFEMQYDVDPLRQTIADSWPDKLDDTVARREWDWSPRYDLDAMVDDMLENLRRKLA